MSFVARCSAQAPHSLQPACPIAILVIHFFAAARMFFLRSHLRLNLLSPSTAETPRGHNSHAFHFVTSSRQAHQLLATAGRCITKSCVAANVRKGFVSGFLWKWREWSEPGTSTCSYEDRGTSVKGCRAPREGAFFVFFWRVPSSPAYDPAKLDLHSRECLRLVARWQAACELLEGSSQAVSPGRWLKAR